MIRLPVLESLNVEGYGLFPGTKSTPGLQVEIGPGLTVVLGANGLGKTTLVTMLYRLLTGPFEIPALASGGTLGTGRLTAVRMQKWERRIFAARVVDEAEDATATLTFRLGESTICVTRSLATLDVIALKHDNEELQATDDRFQQLVVDTSQVPQFGDWILLLRYLVFYFEDRRALVWDPTAQRQVLRLLLLPSETAAEWAAKERAVLELDSRVRNLTATLNREEGAAKKARAKAQDGQKVADEIRQIEKELEGLTPQLEELADGLPDAEAARQSARLRSLTLEQEHDAALRSLERLQLNRIAQAFPDHTETARYLISRLMSTDICQTCGSNVPTLAADLEARIEGSRCVICDSAVTRSPKNTRSLERQIRAQSAESSRLNDAWRSAEKVRNDAEADYEAKLREFRSVETKVAKLRARHAGLVRHLPAEERDIRAQFEGVSTLRGRLASLREDLDLQRAEFESQVRNDMLTMTEYRTSIIEAFQSFASGFLFEACNLTWTPHKDRVGQTGPTVEYPAFEFEMSGSDFPSPVRRTSPNQVSESQREFIDLSFRMALMAVAVDGAIGSLAIDAPEASLDAVFSERAAEVLAKFADPSHGNRLFVTSNLVDGQLIPNLLRRARIRSAKNKRVVDLLEIAVPTTAIRELSDEYRRVRDDLFSARSKSA